MSSLSHVESLFGLGSDSQVSTSTCSPSSDLKDLLVARARLNTHFHHSHPHSPKSPDLESIRTLSSVIPTVRPSTPASSPRRDRLTTTLHTPASFTISCRTEGSQYSPSLISSDLETETLHACEPDRLSLGSVSVGSTYSPVILKARRTAAGLTETETPSEIRDSESLDLEDQDALASALTAPQARSPSTAVMLSEERFKTFTDQDSTSPGLSQMKTFLGPKLTRHGDAPWSAASTEDCASDSSHAPTSSHQSSSTCSVPASSSDSLANHSVTFRQIPHVLSHALTGASRRHGCRGPTHGLVVFDIVEPVSNAHGPPSSSCVNEQDLHHLKHFPTDASHPLRAPGMHRRNSSSSNGTTSPSTNVTTPSTSYSSLASVKASYLPADPAVLESEPTLVVPFQDCSDTIPNGQTDGFHHIHAPNDLKITGQSTIPSLPSDPASKSSSTAHALLHPTPEPFPPMVPSATNHSDPVPRTVPPTNLTSKILRAKKSTGFLRSLKKAVGSVTHEEIRVVSGPVGQVVRNGGADPMPPARALPCPVLAPQPTRYRNKSLGEKIASLGSQQSGSTSANPRLAPPNNVPQNLLTRRGVEGLRPTLNLRPISMAFSAGFAAELLHGSDHSNRSGASSPLSSTLDSSTPGLSDRSGHPSPALSSPTCQFLPASQMHSAPLRHGATKSEVSELDRQARCLRDEIASLKLERDAYLHSLIPHSPVSSHFFFFQSAFFETRFEQPAN